MFEPTIAHNTYQVQVPLELLVEYTLEQKFQDEIQNSLG